MKRAARACALAALCLGAVSLAQSATITIQNMDSAGEGLNDPMPFTPIGGNPATTLGQARLNVLNRAAQLWGALINSSSTIVVEAKFDPLTCMPSSATLGTAGPKWMFHDFPSAPLPQVFYPAALASAINPALNRSNSAGDIVATFNSTVNGDPNCLQGSYFYLGYDHQLNSPNYAADLLGVVLHEFGHGLGFLTVVDGSGQGLASGSTHLLSVFDQFVYDEGVGLFWKDMTAAQRASSINGGGAGNTLLAWNSARVNAQAGRESAGRTPQGHVRLNAPAVYDGGSSGSHWDGTASPDLLMEPRYSRNTGNHTDLTTCVLYELGWTGSRCPDDLAGVAQSVNVNAGVAQAITLAAINTNGATVSYSSSAQPMHGTLGAIAGNSVTYTPVAGYVGADQFSYTVSDGISNSRPAIVSISVQVPTLVADAQSLNATAGTALPMTLTATGGGGGAISYAITTPPSHGTLGAINGAQLSYTPAAGYSGADQFSFQASTSLVTSAAATVSITVQAAASGGGSGAVTGTSGGGGALGGYGLLALALGLALRLRPRAGVQARRAR
jgi:hypothetical protein